LPSVSYKSACSSPNYILDAFSEFLCEKEKHQRYPNFPPLWFSLRFTDATSKYFLTTPETNEQVKSCVEFIVPWLFGRSVASPLSLSHSQ